MPPIAERTLWIDSPPVEVWGLLSRFENWAAWGPSVRSVEVENEAVTPGGRGRVLTPLGLALPFEIQGVEPGRFWDWNVGGIPATGHRLTRKGSGSEVTFTVSGYAYPYVFVLARGLTNLKRIAESSA